MAAQGNGKGGKSITSTSAYQELFKCNDAGGTDGAPVRGYTVKPVGEDAVVEVTYENSSQVREFAVPNGETFPIVVRQSFGKITMVRAKGEVGIGVPVYGNVLVP